MTQAFFLNPDHADPLVVREWDRAWRQMGEHYHAPGETVFEDTDTGECLQYMGTYLMAAGWTHEFRHRRHPLTGRREVVHLGASVGLVEALDSGQIS